MPLTTPQTRLMDAPLPRAVPGVVLDVVSLLTAPPALLPVPVVLPEPAEPILWQSDLT